MTPEAKVQQIASDVSTVAKRNNIKRGSWEWKSYAIGAWNVIACANPDLRDFKNVYIEYLLRPASRPMPHSPTRGASSTDRSDSTATRLDTMAGGVGPQSSEKQ